MGPGRKRLGPSLLAGSEKVGIKYDYKQRRRLSQEEELSGEWSTQDDESAKGGEVRSQGEV